MAGTLTVSDFNIAAWKEGDFVRAYENTHVKPAESALLSHHGETLGDRVLELGCGAGRLTRVLAERGGQVTALDVSVRMVEACARNVPAAHAEVGDLRDLSSYADGAFTGIVASDNVLDVLDDGDRRAALSGWARALAPGGILLFSSHNHAFAPHVPGVMGRAWYARHLVSRIRNHRVAHAYEHDEGSYAIVNDGAHEHRLAHYYIGRDAQERQLAESGFELLECLDREGRPVAPGEAAEPSSELHYAAKRP
jgi:SAM-dependent methyltransferase